MKKAFLLMIPFLMLAACQPKGEKVPALDLSNLDTQLHQLHHCTTYTTYIFI